LDCPDVVSVEEAFLKGLALYQSLIQEYVDGGDKLKRAYEGLTREQLLSYPIPGTWSLQQIAIHMMDSDLIGADRMKRVASMDKPLLIGYDETAFNQLPGIDGIDAFEAIDVFCRNRKMLAVILSRLPSETFQRFGIHNEKGKVTLEYLIQNYIEHLDYHLDFVAKKRALLQA
jgi:hypothetical protein